MILAIILTVLQLFDGWTTYQILKRGGYELNPVMQKLIARVGAYNALAWSKVFAIAFIWLLAWLEAYIALVVLALAFAWIAYHNWKIYVRLRTGKP